MVSWKQLKAQKLEFDDLSRGRTNDVNADISPRLMFINAPIVSNSESHSIPLDFQ
jgi:hypothetical protein